MTSEETKPEMGSSRNIKLIKRSTLVCVLIGVSIATVYFMNGRNFVFHGSAGSKKTFRQHVTSSLKSGLQTDKQISNKAEHAPLQNYIVQNHRLKDKDTEGDDVNNREVQLQLPLPDRQNMPNQRPLPVRQNMPNQRPLPARQNMPNQIFRGRQTVGQRFYTPNNNQRPFFKRPVNRGPYARRRGGEMQDYYYYNNNRPNRRQNFDYQDYYYDDYNGRPSPQNRRYTRPGIRKPKYQTVNRPAAQPESDTETHGGNQRNQQVVHSNNDDHYLQDKGNDKGYNINNNEAYNLTANNRIGDQATQTQNSLPPERNKLLSPVRKEGTNVNKYQRGGYYRNTDNGNYDYYTAGMIDSDDKDGGSGDSDSAVYDDDKNKLEQVTTPNLEKDILSMLDIRLTTKRPPATFPTQNALYKNRWNENAKVSTRNKKVNDAGGQGLNPLRKIFLNGQLTSTPASGKAFTSPGLKLALEKSKLKAINDIPDKSPVIGNRNDTRSAYMKADDYNIINEQEANVKNNTGKIRNPQFPFENKVNLMNNTTPDNAKANIKSKVNIETTKENITAGSKMTLGGLSNDPIEQKSQNYKSENEKTIAQRKAMLKHRLQPPNMHKDEKDGAPLSAKNKSLTNVKENSDILQHPSEEKEIDSSLLIPPNVYIPPGQVNRFNWENSNPDPEVIKCVLMRTVYSSVDICIHPVEKDPEVSAHLERDGSWERQMVQDVQLAVLSGRTTGFIDVGAGIGVCTLAVASLKREVIAVEPSAAHIWRMKQSVERNKLKNHVTLFKNVVSDRPKSMVLILKSDNVNDIDIHRFSPWESTGAGEMVNAITLNDVARATTLKTAVLRIETLGVELWNILRSSEELFQRVNLDSVIVKWDQTNRNLNDLLVRFFVNKGYTPHSRFISTPMDIKNSKDWHSKYIVWKKDKSLKSIIRDSTV